MIDFDSLGKYIDPLAARNQAVRIIADIGGDTSPEAMMIALHYWVHNEIKTVPDPRDTDFIASVQDTLSCKGGDALDQSILLCSLCEGVGIQSKLGIIEQSDGFYPLCYGSIGLGRIPEDTPLYSQFYTEHGVVFKNLFTSYSKIGSLSFLLLDPQSQFAGDLQAAIAAGFGKYTEAGKSFQMIGDLCLLEKA